MDRDVTAADLVGTHRTPRWQRILQGALVSVMVAATITAMTLVVRQSMQLGRMTTEVSVAQQRTTNLHNLQVGALQLRQALSEADTADPASVEAAVVRRGLLTRFITVVQALFPASSGQAAELGLIKTSLGTFDWDGLSDGRVPLAEAATLVGRIAIRVKALYDQQEKFFYDATRQSLRAKTDNEHTLAVLVSLVVVMAAVLLVLLRRRARNQLGVAYDALLGEVSERRLLQDQLSHHAFHDALTGLPNRAQLLQRLTEAMRGTSPPSVVLIDLDGFKDVNDTLGHAAGDELLQQVAERLRACVRAEETVARLGGDEFAIVVPADERQGAIAISRRLIDVIASPLLIGGQEISISASVGIARLGGQDSAETLLSDADIAMYAAKKAGKAKFEVYDPRMRDETQHRVRLEQQLARAVAGREIEVHYQPIVDLAGGRVSAVEALARWRHPEDGLVAPGVFIPIAENSGLIREIGRDVLRQACATVQQWRTGIPACADLRVTVNVSVRQLLSGTFSHHLVEALRDTGLPPAALTLEITESLVLEESDAVAAELARIKDIGVRLAMDDFGAGYSSIALLLRLQVDVLKIDKSFLDVDSREQGTLLRAIAELGHTLGLTVVAEGVETEEQFAHVRAAGCDAAQGYLLARPMTGPDIRDRLTAEEAGWRLQPDLSGTAAP